MSTQKTTWWQNLNNMLGSTADATDQLEQWMKAMLMSSIVTNVALGVVIVVNSVSNQKK